MKDLSRILKKGSRSLFVDKSLLRDQSFELYVVPGIERVGSIGILHTISPLFVHPHIWAGFCAHNGFKGIPARLRNFTWAGIGAKINRRMKNHAVTPSWQRVAMARNKESPRTLLEPSVRRSNTGVQSKTANGDSCRTGKNR